MRTRPRPVLKLPRTCMEICLEVIAVLGLISVIGMTVSGMLFLPETVAMHFNLSGHPDHYGSKNTLIFFPVTVSFIYTVLTVMSFYPHTYHYSWPITAWNAPQQYLLARQCIAWIKTEIIFFLGAIEWLTIQSMFLSKASVFLLLVTVVAFVVLLTSFLLYLRMAEERY
ncbi:MAG TPA: DUF1648 domain-containing protein [Ktedonobacteraceae bacterium]|nr:DUF1648 domain-containing protein [Ktedonobacteraceae bacterium]